MITKCKTLFSVLILLFSYSECQKNLEAICGLQRVFRHAIVGGNYTVRGEYPWKVALVSETGEYFCGGSLVSNNIVVTAAHCLKGKSGSHHFEPKDIIVQLGVFDLSKKFERGRTSVDVKSIHLHPDWNINVDSFDADIAVLVLATEVIFNSYVRPVCIMGSQSTVSAASTGVAVGFGITENRSLANIAKTLNVPIKNYHECTKNGDRLKYLLSARTFCGGPGNGKGICEGDSGSGLYVINNGRYYLKGLVSASFMNFINECDVDSFGIYTEVTEYCGWIKSGGTDKYAQCTDVGSLIHSKRSSFGNTLSSGQCLKPNEYLESQNKCFKLIYQDNGDLVSYQMSTMRVIWSTHTSYSCANRACMQTDGNFVVYDCNDHDQWYSHTIKNLGKRLILQNDGNLVIYNSSNAPLWASNTLRSC